MITTLVDATGLAIYLTIAKVVLKHNLLVISDEIYDELIEMGKKRGVLTYNEINDALPSEFFSPEEIEDLMEVLQGMGVEIVAGEEEVFEEPEEETLSCQKCFVLSEKEIVPPILREAFRAVYGTCGQRREENDVGSKLGQGKLRQTSHLPVAQDVD